MNTAPTDRSKISQDATTIGHIPLRRSRQNVDSKHAFRKVEIFYSGDTERADVPICRTGYDGQINYKLQKQYLH